jgi:AbrB family looped-hinge helix DNA binding protein
MIPAAIRKRLNLREGSLLQVEERDGSLILISRDYFDFPRRGNPHGARALHE